MLTQRKRHRSATPDATQQGQKGLESAEAPCGAAGGAGTAEAAGDRPKQKRCKAGRDEGAAATLPGDYDPLKVSRSSDDVMCCCGLALGVPHCYHFPRCHPASHDHVSENKKLLASALTTACRGDLAQEKVWHPSFDVKTVAVEGLLEALDAARAALPPPEAPLAPPAAPDAVAAGSATVYHLLPTLPEMYRWLDALTAKLGKSSAVTGATSNTSALPWRRVQGSRANKTLCFLHAACGLHTSVPCP